MSINIIHASYIIISACDLHLWINGIFCDCASLFSNYSHPFCHHTRISYYYQNFYGASTRGLLKFFFRTSNYYICHIIWISFVLMEFLLLCWSSNGLSILFGHTNIYLSRSISLYLRILNIIIVESSFFLVY